MSGYSRWRESGHLQRAIKTAGGPERFETEVRRLRARTRDASPAGPDAGSPADAGATPEPISHREALTAFAEAFTALDELAASLDDTALTGPSRCRGWAVCDVLCHLHLGVQDVLVALATPTEAEPDGDFVSVWQDSGTDEEAALANLRFVRLVASAYRRPASLVARMSPAVQAAVRQAGVVPEETRVEQYGRSIAVADLLAQWAVEAAIHHLDITVGLDGTPPPPASALAVVRRTFDHLAGAPAGALWSDADYTLKGGGRLPLTGNERERLGPAADRFPLVG
ncbi:maleylpyruvate isomerase N-terminal domain-containing protein [Planomonospora sp. ID91781]|uniref:maleylpyruvate isomerase N-terminal domain-containing protein n=1 Tax=Planomonospora sp. ID91781 TaxID=2738135 RepID=UPI0018C3605C|nr:maleylpyruvate isomerase N-terminal domain-containing protein [Planomonospora sp. ID91781]MBG0825458.1 maleylpyruvate isomerase N-terminal domain-containing protein [Planomonospora sp. ID91781]